MNESRFHSPFTIHPFGKVHVMASQLVMQSNGVDRYLHQIEQESVRTFAAALYQRAQKIMTLAHQETPVRNRGGGTLRASGKVYPPAISGSHIEVVLGFGGAAARYAASVHANPRSGKTGGIGPQGQKYRSWSEVGKYRFLLDPFTTVNATFQADMQKLAQDILRKK